MEKNIALPIIDYENFRDRINIIDPFKACQGCKRAVSSGLSDIIENYPDVDLSDVTIVLGPVEDLDKFKLTDKIILLGIALFHIEIEDYMYKVVPKS